ncbi:MAG: 3-dehydroquinate synthase [Oscillospiraceae bacterium]|nr:3-dehydroquinate synthase [Oscillospiraceae bacterium]
MIRAVTIRASRQYEVLLERGLLDRAGPLLRELSAAGTACVVAGERVAPLYAECLLASLRGAGFRTLLFTHRSGEEHKDLQTYAALLDFLAREGVDRSDLLVSLGGGVTGDLTGFAAATYQRGMDYVQIPTTLLAMVDASVGGKTAVDLPAGKNLAGCFWQPLCVLCDPDLLTSLDPEELRCGAAEVIKCAVLRDSVMFAFLARGGLDAACSDAAIGRCVEIKRDLVEADEFDRGQRRLLNLGHSFGHAIEACSGYRVRHGQAVAIGMAMVARAAAAKGIFPADERDALLGLLGAFGLPTHTDSAPEALSEQIRQDKKRSGDTICLVVPERIGSCRILPVPLTEIPDWIRLGGA